MITQYPAGSTFWNKIPKSQLPINRISSSFFFVSHLLASLKAIIECSVGPSGRTNISKLNFASGRTGKTAGPASSTLVKLSLTVYPYTQILFSPKFQPATLCFRVAILGNIGYYVFLSNIYSKFLKRSIIAF